VKDKDKDEKTPAAAEAKTEEVKTEEAKASLKVRFKNAYMGDLGNFQAGRVYDLPAKAYAVLKNDCERVE